MRDRSYLCFHMQSPFWGWNIMLAQAAAAGFPYRAIKSFHPEDYRPAQQASPGIIFIYRYHNDHQSPWVFAEDKDAAADDYISRFYDSVVEHIGPNPSTPVYIESVNEEYPTANAYKLLHIVEFDRAFIRAIRRNLPGFRPVVFTAAVGNPGHNEYGALDELARETVAASGAFGYHGYHTVHHKRSFVADPGVARDLHQRWVEVDNYLTGRGIYVDWALGEIGATAGDDQGYGPAVEEGWRHSSCWDGDEDGCLEDLKLRDAQLANTEAARNGRLISAAIFTSNPDPNQWRHFRLVGTMAQKLTDYVASGVMQPPPGATVHWAYQAAESTDGETPRRVYRCVDHGGGVYGPVSWFEEGNDMTPSERLIWEASVQEQIERGVPLNPNALLQGGILRAGLTPVHRERRIYAPEDSGHDNGTQHPTFPVGTEEERRLATDDWPGKWIDANPYGRRYLVRNGHYAYHTGADLNLNDPHWDADRGRPVYAIADGEVTYAGRFNDNWGIIVVIKHEGFYSRYSAVAGLSVAVGDVVIRGQQVAVVDRHKVGEPFHLHFDISTTDILAENPGDWPGLTWSRLERDYVDPLRFILDHRHSIM